MINFKVKKAEKATGVSAKDVRKIAMDIFETQLTDDQIIGILEDYPNYVEMYPDWNWDNIIELQMDEMEDL